ncbi:hypothetical protein DBR06_SOUSAS10210019, partial [Sousa chinensis]
SFSSSVHSCISRVQLQNPLAPKYTEKTTQPDITT